MGEDPSRPPLSPPRVIDWLYHDTNPVGALPVHTPRVSPPALQHQRTLRSTRPRYHVHALPSSSRQSMDLASALAPASAFASTFPARSMDLASALAPASAFASTFPARVHASPSEPTCKAALPPHLASPSHTSVPRAHLHAAALSVHTPRAPRPRGPPASTHSPLTPRCTRPFDSTSSLSGPRASAPSPPPPRHWPQISGAPRTLSPPPSRPRSLSRTHTSPP
ncbi:hypothetical protein B0H14DRAFT_3453729 [Mycena olivaceomarginata]|nr:hypothetical protein B0H14DRAFT_3453729 [Mycena olivaceomarginata]